MSGLEQLPSWAPEVQRVARTREVTAAWLLRYASERTRTEYQADLRIWHRWCSAIDVDPLDAERGHVDAWVREHEGRMAPSSVRRRLSTWSSWYRALVEAGIVDRNPVLGVRRPELDTSTGVTPAVEGDDVTALLDAAGQHSPAAWALVRLLAEQGLRITSACTVRAEDVGRLPDGSYVLRVRVKGGRIDTRPITAELGQVLERLALDVGGSGPVLRTSSGLPLDRSRARTLLDTLERRAGVGHVHPHMFRAWAITTLLDQDGISPHAVQRFAGHSSFAMTARYDRNPQRQAATMAAILAGLAAGPDTGTHPGGCTVSGGSEGAQ